MGGGIDAEKVVTAIEARMQAMLAYANTPAAGMDSGNEKVYEHSGFSNALDYCRAHQPEFRLCEELLSSGR